MSDSRSSNALHTILRPSVAEKKWLPANSVYVTWERVSSDSDYKKKKP